MLNSVKKLIAGASVLTIFALPATASATVYDFDLEFNGAALSMDAGSTDPIGISLVAGDSFDYNIQTASTGFWNVDTGGNFFLFLAFTIFEDGNRVGDMALSLLLDGVEQFSLVEAGLTNSLVHLGTNTVNLTTGLMFDEIVLTYDLISSFDTAAVPAANSATITHYTIGTGPVDVPGGFSHSNISYTRAASPVPEPGLLGLVALGLFGIGFSACRAKRAL